MFAVQQVIHEFTLIGSFALGNFIFVMRKHIVHPSGMDVKSFSQIFHAHCTAFQMPAGTTVTPGTGPFYISVIFTPGFPESKVCHGVFLIFIAVDPDSGTLLFPVDPGKFTVFFEFVNGKINRAILGFIGIAFFKKQLHTQAYAENRFAVYGKLFQKIAVNILGSDSDAEECVSDGLFRLWNEIPPSRPEKLGAFGARIVRNLSLDALRRENALRRGGGKTTECLEELDGCLPADEGDIAEKIALKDSLNSFLGGLSPQSRQIFLKRYWYMQSISEIAGEMGLGESKVKMSLLRIRNALKTHLDREEQ